MKCARHPDSETALSCARCLTPICPKCAVSGAVGMLCRACAGVGKSPLYQVPPARMLLALIAGLAAGTMAGFVLQFASFWIFFIAPAIGGLLGQTVLWATAHRRGPKVEAITAISVVVGGLLAAFLSGQWMGYVTGANWAGLAFFVIALILTAGAALGKIRYW